MMTRMCFYKDAISSKEDALMLLHAWIAARLA